MSETLYNKTFLMKVQLADKNLLYKKYKIKFKNSKKMQLAKNVNQRDSVV